MALEILPNKLGPKRDCGIQMDPPDQLEGLMSSARKAGCGPLPGLIRKESARAIVFPMNRRRQVMYRRP